MIIGLIGKRGCGKTLTMVKEAVDYVKKGRTIYTNFYINKELFTKKQQTRIKLLSDEFFQNYSDMKLYNCGVFLDEIYVYIDSRASMSKRNKIMSYFFNQTRKRDVDLYYTTQFLHQVDLRLRSNTEMFVFPKTISLKEKSEIWIVNKYVLIAGKRMFAEQFLGNKYFNYYKTDEIIDFNI